MRTTVLQEAAFGLIFWYHISYLFNPMEKIGNYLRCICHVGGFSSFPGDDDDVILLPQIHEFQAVLQNNKTAARIVQKWRQITAIMHPTVLPMPSTKPPLF